MIYQQQLQTTEWRNKRKEILLRDFCCCIKCKNSSIISKSRKIEPVEIKDTREWYFFNYYEPSSVTKSNMIANREVTVVNPFVELHELMSLEMFIGQEQGKEYLSGVKVKDINWNEVFKKKREYIAHYQKKFPHLQVRGDEDYEKEIINRAEKNKDKKWYVVPGLNVHHRYYMKGKMAWDYPDNVFETLCSECHEAFHAENKVPYYSESGELILNLTPCDRCGGHGIIPAFTHIQNGICFKCFGKGYEDL